jgi:hypothetical protein
MVALVATLAGPAAAKKKKKQPKPYTSEVVSIQLAHPVFNGQSETVVGVTAQEFIQSCAIPGSNGLDAYVWEVPAEYQKIESTIVATGSDPAIDYDLDIYLFDAECNLTAPFNTESADEYGALLKDTAFILVHNYLTGPVSVQIELTPR